LLSGCQNGSAPRASAQSETVVKSTTAFEDVRPASGIDFQVVEKVTPFRIAESVGHGLGLVDSDADGLLDIVLLGTDSVRLYRNLGGWRFKDVTAQYGLRQAGFWQGAATGDFNNDGFTDLYLCGYGSSALYQNESGRSFTEITEPAGLQPKPVGKAGVLDWRTSAAFFDADNDGLVDLYVGRYCQSGSGLPQYCGKPGARVACTPEIYEPQIGSFYHNLGGGKFKDKTKEFGFDVAQGKTLGVAVADYDADGDIDVALANDEVAGNLFRNNGKGRFDEIGTPSGTAFDNSGRAHGGMGIDWGDFTGDGKLDLYVTTFRDEVKNLYQNLGGDLFRDIADVQGLAGHGDPWVGWGVKFLDYDSDGRLDLFIANGHVMDNVEVLGQGQEFKQPLLLLRQQPDGRAANVSGASGALFGARYSARGACVGDLDNDGRPDIVVSRNDGQPLLLRNTHPDQGGWIGLHLRGTRANRLALGAEVTIEVNGTKLVRNCTTSGSTLSASDARVLVGLGSAETANVWVRWPGGKREHFATVRAGAYHLLEEGTGKPQPVNYVPGR
jgi:hypothetical protein